MSTKKEIPLQHDMFTRELVDNRTARQKKRDRDRELPKQNELFSAREVLQFGVNGRPLLPLADKTKLSLEMQDPRTPDEKELDLKRAAEAQTCPMIPQSTESLPEDISVTPDDSDSVAQ